MIRLILLSIVMLISPITTAVDYDNTPGAISERLKKVGSVCLTGEPCDQKPVLTGDTAALSTVDTGANTYSTYCAVCHNAGVAGAPMLSDASTWSTRLDKGIETVYSNAIGGIGGMPAKGMCMSCSDDDIVTTVNYMLSEAGVSLD